MNAYIKRIIYLPDADVSGKSEDVLSSIKEIKTREVIISDTFLVEDDKGMMVAKEKIVYEGNPLGKSLVFGSI